MAITNRHRSSFVSLCGVLFCLSIVGFRCAVADSTSEVVTEVEDSTTTYAGSGFSKCSSQEQIEATTTEQVSGIIRKLNGAGKPFKIRANRRSHHTPNTLICPGAGAIAKLPVGENPDLKHDRPDVHSVSLLLHGMNRVLAVDRDRLRLTVQAGMTVQGLADAATDNGLSMPPAWLPVYAGLTVGGSIAASAHGTGAGTDSSPGDRIVELVWVNGKGNIIRSSAGDDQGKKEISALVGGLGLLGVLTEVTFELLPPGALVQVETIVGDDGELDTLVKDHLQSLAPNFFYVWRPDLGKYKAFTYTPLKKGDVVRHPFHPNGKGNLVPSINLEGAEFLGNHMKEYTLDVLDSGPNAAALNAQGCALSEAVFNTPGFLDGDVGLFNATIPSSTATLGEDCSPECVHQGKFTGILGEDIEFAIKLSDLGDWMKDVKAILKAEERARQEFLDSRYGEGKVKLCLNPGFSWVRFGQATANLLATTAGFQEPVAHVMETFAVSGLTPYLHSKADHIIDVIEQMTLCKYRGRPHWGKNSDRIFTHPKCHVRDSYPSDNFDEMLRLQNVHDPSKIFESALFNRVVERRGPVYGDRCALRRTCYCQKDSHCGDGFKCVPSVSFPEFKVCKVQYPSREPKEEL